VRADKGGHTEDNTYIGHILFWERQTGSTYDVRYY
jgi:hypothetical protein